MDELRLDDISVIRMHDAIALPETGASPASSMASSWACHSCGSCCCQE
ncbi:MAG: thiazolylpeptide-type bacteriocin [Pseudonocardiales bacterium]|nr:MAG: thiazolylpeptide-type bacteriocin [Pseudonocardiales bacterium]